MTPASTIVNAIPVSIGDPVKMEWKDTIVIVHLVRKNVFVFASFRFTQRILPFVF